MNSTQHQLNRLLAAAARAPRALSDEVPFALEAKVMASWRRLPAGAGEIPHLLLPFLRRAAVCACLLMLLSIAFSYRDIIAGENVEATLANSAVDLSLLP